MRKLFMIASAVALLSAVIAPTVPATAQGTFGHPFVSGTTDKQWRIGANLTWFDNSRTRDEIGNGYGLEVEHILSQSKTGELSGYAAYRRFSHASSGQDNALDYYSVGTKIRMGPGASINSDGIYYGAGVAFTVLKQDGGINNDTSAGIEGLAVLGLNFAHSWYGELSYRSPSDSQNIDSNNVAFVLGYRF